ncbi:hypothetical protein [Natrononativus amylolyticus]|uniref:hypothetical protein n=1 Tax=Natrononativus amylolyticus TaxID=2963434 RepID=UPI0020CF3720|nr:hypothetical protein [Natrononativus amylolyticus]
MLNPVRVDAAVDLAYGALIALSIVLIMLAGTDVGIAFGVGVFASYVVHVVWKMARFDPDWMTRAVQESVEESVGETVEQTVGETVEQKVGETVEETVEETVGETVEKQVGETVEETVGGTVEERVGETVEEAVERTVGKQLEAMQAEVEAVDERIDRRPREDEVEELIDKSADGNREADGEE